jgi:hypothetical protein
MVKSFTSKSDEYNRLNLQLYYIEEIAKLISRIGNLLSLSEGYSVSAFRQAYGKILTLKDLIDVQFLRLILLTLLYNPFEDLVYYIH